MCVAVDTCISFKARGMKISYDPNGCCVKPRRGVGAGVWDGACGCSEGLEAAVLKAPQHDILLVGSQGLVGLPPLGYDNATLYREPSSRASFQQMFLSSSHKVGPRKYLQS